MMGDFAVIDLNDVYLSRKDFQRIERKLNRKIAKMNLSLAIACFSIGCMFGMILENRERICNLEKNEETAG